jgi:Protein of unknown function (DUF3570)
MAMTSNQCECSGTETISSLRRHPFQRRRQVLALTVAVALPLLRVSRAFGDENVVGYRKGYYQEDNNRIHVSTDTWQFDVGLRDNIRVSGEVVVDSISGATPNGAPPQSQWPFPTLTQLYNQNYNTLFQAQVNDPNNHILLDSGVFNPSGTVPYDQQYQAYTNYIATTYGGQVATQATNSAVSSYQQLTNSPSYHNKKVPLTEMHDHRNAFNIALPMTFGQHQITPSFAYSAESDYISIGGALNYSLSLNDKNTTLSAGWAHNGDTVRDDNFNWQAKMTDNVFLGLVQLFGPKSYLTVDASFSCEHGYLADPYRGVMFESQLQNNPEDPALGPEVRPRHRNSEILYTSWTQFVTPLNGSYELSYRFFHDSYGIIANTVGFDWHQKIGKHIVISPMFRYYIQNTAADFYYLLVPNTNPTYYSSDYRLSQMESFTAGVTITYRIQKHISLDASYTRYQMQGLDGKTDQSAYPSANIVSFGGRVWF